MKTIKTRNTNKGIKTLDKAVGISKRMKDTFVRTKERAGETQNPQDASPTDYAVERLQEKAQAVAQKTVNHLSNPRQKARNNVERAKKHFQDVQSQLPFERRHAAEQAQKIATKTRDNADKLQEVADKTGIVAKDAKTAVNDAKQTLKQRRVQGRKAIREVKQKARFEYGGASKIESGNNGFTLKDKMLRFHNNSSQRSTTTGQNRMEPATPISSANSGSVNTTTGDAAHSGFSRPNYMSKGVSATKRVRDATKSVEEPAKAAKSTVKGFKETTKGSIKTVQNSVKTAEKSAKAAVKTAQQAAKTAQKTAQTAAKAAKVAEKAAHAAAKAAAQTAKAVTKAVVAFVKAAIAAIKGLIAVIAAGGWVAVVIIIIICLIALLVGSIYGIFFSSEPDPSTSQTINSVIAEINAEYTDQIDTIISENAHDLLDMSGARAEWKQVLAIYTVRTVSDPNNPMEVATMTDEKALILRVVFWDINSISNELDSFGVEEDILDDEGLPTGETTTVTYTVLRISVSYKTCDEMAVHYGFGNEQNDWLEELLKPEYHNLWNTLLYGISSVGDGTMIGIADTQIGNIGGETYWRWYGLSERDEWCAIFVSWVAYQCGYIDAGIIPRFASCTVGIEWFQDRGQWMERDYMPVPGTLIFFDWETDGTADHVGIVESVVDGKVNTIEGNSSDSVRRRSYDIDSMKIFGYGVPLFSSPVR